jgi:hypothetical protein
MWRDVDLWSRTWIYGTAEVLMNAYEAQTARVRLAGGRRVARGRFGFAEQEQPAGLEGIPDTRTGKLGPASSAVAPRFLTMSPLRGGAGEGGLAGALGYGLFVPEIVPAARQNGLIRANASQRQDACKVL